MAPVVLNDPPKMVHRSTNSKLIYDNINKFGSEFEVDIMLVISGIWIAILPKMKYFSLDIKKLKVAYHCIGIYISLLGVLLSMIDVKINDELMLLALTASILLQISTIILKIKGGLSIIDILAIVSSVYLLISAVAVAIIDIEELTSSIIMITGSLLLLSISFKSISKSC